MLYCRALTILRELTHPLFNCNCSLFVTSQGYPRNIEYLY
jgi:hypothetical protein